MKLRPHATLTQVLRWLLQASLPVAIVVLLANVYGSYLPLPDTVALPLGFANLILYFVTAVTLLVWIYRTNKNLGALSDQWMEFTPGRSVGWFFVPFANLWKPYHVMKELWHISHRDREISHSIVGWWWTCWLLSRALAELSAQVVESDHTLAVLLYAASDAMDIGIIVLTLTIVTRIGAAYAKNIVEPSPLAYQGTAPAPL